MFASNWWKFLFVWNANIVPFRIAAEKCYGRIESATQSEREKEMENNNLILLISDLLHGIAYTISDEL